MLFRACRRCVDHCNGDNDVDMERNGVLREGVDVKRDREESVRLDSLDNYRERMGIEEIDIPRIDLEGHELSVLKGSTRMLGQRRIRHIQFGYSGNYIDSRVLLKDMFSMLQGFRYRLYKMHCRELGRVDEHEQRPAAFQCANWVASR